MFILILSALFGLLSTMHKVKLMMDVRIVASEIAGIISAIASAPDSAIYCYTIPHWNDYTVAIGGGYVVVEDMKEHTFGISRYPSIALNTTKFSVIKGENTVLLVKKIRLGTEERVFIKVGDFDLKACREV